MAVDIQKKKDFLEQIDLFVLDMDGTFYLGDVILEGSLDFLQKVKETGKHYIFFTNNSSKSPENYINKLAKMNCTIGRDQIMTSGDVTIEFLKRTINHNTKKIILCHISHSFDDYISFEEAVKRELDFSNVLALNPKYIGPVIINLKEEKEVLEFE